MNKMEMTRIVFVSFILATWAVSPNCASIRPHVQPLIPPSTSSAPTSSSSDCSEVTYAMSDCMPFMSDGSKSTMPEGSCCSGYEAVFKRGSSCICEVIESSVDMGIPVNITKTMALPFACGINDAPPLTDCDVPMPPGVAMPPGMPSATSTRRGSPPPKPDPKINIVPAPSVVTTPAPYPTESQAAGAYSVYANIVISLISMLVFASLI